MAQAEGATMKCGTAVRNPDPKAFRQRLVNSPSVDGSSRVESRRRAVRRILANHPELITAGCVCQLCRVNFKMLCWWIDSGLWAFPRFVRLQVFFYERAAVQRWIRTGEWPSNSLFRDRPTD